MREDLLGYLLGALEPGEMERISRALRADPVLRAELSRLQESLRPLDDANDLYEPPADLIDRTMAGLSTGNRESETPQPPTGEQQADEAAGPKWVSPRRAGRRPVRLSTPRRLRAGDDGRLAGWRLTDMVATAVAGIVIAGLVLPSILRERSGARQQLCQSQLREMGIALISYATRRADQRFPELATEGPESFSGYHAIELAAAGLLPSMPTPRWCPSLDVPPEWVGKRLPTREELRRAGGMQLIQYQKMSGGHYAYSLGILENDRYVAPRFLGRSHFAILADAPLQSLDGWVMAHEGRGGNILYEDGHVAFFSNWNEGVQGDHPFLNRVGQLEHGLDPDDAALAGSQYPPFLPARSR